MASNDVANLDGVNPNTPTEVSRETFYYYLEVLPPVYMGKEVLLGSKRRRVSYGFAEGEEIITAFWVEGSGAEEKFYAQQTREVNRL